MDKISTSLTQSSTKNSYS